MIRTPVIFAACLAHLAIFASGVHAQSGACCLDGGACFGGTPASCASAFPPGAYQGDGSSCATAQCGEQGACCFPDGTCQDLFWGPCDSSTGTFQGEGSSCTPNVCPPPAPVPTQINHQGVVSVNGQRFTGDGQFYFAIIDPVTGNSVWTNDATNVGTAVRPNRPVVLPCVTGLYSVRLGDQSLPNMKWVPVGTFSSESRSLRIWFNDGTNGVHQLTPDHVLTSGPYAYRAADANRIPNTIVFTSSGTWTRPQGLRYIEVEVLGGGASGASTSPGGGGGSGCYAKGVLSASELSATEIITVATGVPSTNLGNNGIVGNPSSIGLLVIAGGGRNCTDGGGGSQIGGEGGALSGSAIMGFLAVSSKGGDGFGTTGGSGGSSPYGTGGSASDQTVGNNGTGFGSGGSGTRNTGPSGAGAPGLVIVKEFF